MLVTLTSGGAQELVTVFGKRAGFIGVGITLWGAIDKVSTQGFSSLQTTDYLDFAVTGVTLVFIANPVTGAAIGLIYGASTLFFEDWINENGGQAADFVLGKIDKFYGN